MTTPYDPFARGAHPVGVRSDTWTDASRDRALPVEIWYPAASGHAGQDLDPSQQDAYPAIWITEDMDPDNPPLIPQQAVRDAAPAALPGQLILFAHGYAGHRREATYLCTHLASHGYVVVSADHLGFTSWEVDAMMADDAPLDMAVNRHQMGIDRLGDVPFLVAAATEHGYAQPGPVGVVQVVPYIFDATMISRALARAVVIVGATQLTELLFVVDAAAAVGASALRNAAMMPHRS
jgi:predicted dienelactone hydrolase